jgi:hypothetical protein
VVDEEKRRKVMEAFEKLPRYQRDWINNNTQLNLHDDHILMGEREVSRCILAANRGDIYYKRGNGQN